MMAPDTALVIDDWRRIYMAKQTTDEIFTQAHGDFEQSLLKRSFFKVNNRALADDLVQATFLNTWKYLVKYGKIDSMQAFLFHVLNNLIIDEYRKNKPVSLDLMTEGGFQLAIDDSDRLVNKIDGKAAILLIPLLTKKHREVITMRYLEDISLGDIAAKTKQSKNTVAVQIHRGAEKLALLVRLEAAQKAKRKVVR